MGDNWLSREKHIDGFRGSASGVAVNVEFVEGQALLCYVIYNKPVLSHPLLYFREGWKWSCCRDFNGSLVAGSMDVDLIRYNARVSEGDTRYKI